MHSRRSLYQDFYFDRRGGFLQGESPVARHPIFRWNDAELTMRYLNYYIHVDEKIDAPLTGEQENALAAIETLLGRPEMRIEFSPQPGQMLFTNNHYGSLRMALRGKVYLTNQVAGYAQPTIRYAILNVNRIYTAVVMKTWFFLQFYQIKQNHVFIQSSV